MPFEKRDIPTNVLFFGELVGNTEKNAKWRFSRYFDAKELFEK